jgi:hypothetical protein
MEEGREKDGKARKWEEKNGGSAKKAISKDEQFPEVVSEVLRYSDLKTKK